jgi:hypothetical protein
VRALSPARGSLGATAAGSGACAGATTDAAGLTPPKRCWAGIFTAGKDAVGALDPGAGILSEDVMTTLTGVLLTAKNK